MTDISAAAPGREARTLSNLAVAGFVWRQWMRKPRLYGAFIGFMGLATLADVFVPVAAGRLIDSLSGGGADASGQAHWLALGLFLALAAGVNIARQIGIRMEILASSAVMADMTADAYARVQSMSADWHANAFAGALVRKITRGMHAYDEITMYLWGGVLPGLGVTYGLGVYILINWPLAGLYVLAVNTLFIVMTMAMIERYVRPQNLVSNARDADLGGAVADALTSINTVKSFGAEARETGRFARLAGDWRREVRKTWYRFANTWLVQMIAVLALQAGLAGLLLAQWQAGEASAGDVAFALTAFLVMAGYMRRFGEEVQSLQKGLDDIQDIAGFMAGEPQIADAPGAPDFRPGAGAIEFDQVRFTYGGQDSPLYEGFDLTIAPGEKIALVGPTGSGKSTFVKLIQRLYDIDSGAIRIDGQDVRSVTQASLRQSIAVVPQDPALFHRTLAENIAYARPGASREDIIEAARRARAHDFITDLPQGYDTLVGERGIKLSGGERQRVAIARAILADAPILVFDEATSSLDNETERDIQAALAEVMAGKTAIVIAHRLSTIRDADRILVFQDGAIVEQGTHEALSAKAGGVYLRLAQLARP
ncbi:ABC transporter ATP-binding protein [Alkalicaulis satelles]|uniref:ABC transporter ATP-binding protein n=1 Tax=Alkalicaulis satelles TaxID=2609175 RepID=A0A5M6ZGM0_9PROT|nr:ABC transporter ATP-binding protein [Alkalicaulis satelles]KAA5803916.1 ABC transporter ATP-binding protein [Alkalicaulis satelles]